MFEWLSEQYIKLILNNQVLLGSPSGCGTVELLQSFTFMLLSGVRPKATHSAERVSTQHLQQVCADQAELARNGAIFEVTRNELVSY